MTLHAADRDADADPGTDFYRFANGGWLDRSPIPPGHGSWGSFEEVNERNEEVLLGLLDRAATDPADDLERMVGDYFVAGLDLDAIETAGTAPIDPLLAAVAEVGSVEDALALLPRLHRDGLSGLWRWAVDVDHDDATRHLLWLVQGGLGLPDRDSYDASTDAAVALRTAYVAHVAAQLRNAGAAGADADELAAGVLDLETRIAATHLRSAERRDLDRTLNRFDRDALAALAPGLGLPAYLDALGAGAAVTVNVENPESFTALPALLAATDAAVLRAYLAFHLVRATASALPRAFDEEAFNFYGRRIEGKQEQKERRRRVVAALTSDVGEAVGRLFVQATFPPEAKDRALAMVGEILAEMGASLRTRTWMSDETRERGLAKLASFTVKIGYPDEWRSWDGLGIGRTSYAANRLAAARFESDRQLRRIDEAVDVTEWGMPPHVVNAYYHPMRNEIVFPAGVLQPPFFDHEADDAVNYGAIGAVIAHEVSHGFDDQGRRFDAHGHFSDWWTPEDEARFTELADRLVEQFDGYTVLGDVQVNGRLTLGENIADLGGVTLAQRAHARTSQGAPDVDGLTSAQRFFLAWATVWRGRDSDERARTLAQVDPHAPRQLRVVGPLSNSDAFAAAYGLSEDAPVMRPVKDRLEIW